MPDIQPVFSWGHSRRFNDYSSYIKQKFGGRVQKISVNVGFSCPNRDGTKGTGGCIYCDNSSFTPAYCNASDSIEKQLISGRDFFSHKYPDMRYMAYFQSYTNTYAPIQQLKESYLQAIDCGMVGIIIGTRPDCINEELVKMLAEVNSIVPVVVEFGIESTCNQTLVEINRHHTWQDSLSSIELCAKYGIETGGHLILGLPFESRQTMLSHATAVSATSIKTIKLHQLQVIEGTILAHRYAKNPQYVSPFDLPSYISLVVDFLEQLSPEIVVERFISVSPANKVIAPHWNRMKNFEVVALIDKELQRRNTWQGRLFTA